MEEIIIDGIDVSGCEELDGLYCKLGIQCRGHICLYKQLKRKEKEVQALRSALQEIKEIINMWEVCQGTIGGYSDLAEFDERRLSEIKDILKASEVEE